jgi:hypothetical protein
MGQPILKPFSTSLGNLPNDRLLVIFSMLDMWSIQAVLKTCKRFRSIIYGSNIKLIINVDYIASNGAVVDKKLVRNLMYPLEFKFRNSGLLLLLEFKPVDPEREIDSSSGDSVNVLLWIEQQRITNKAFQSLKWFISKYSQLPIMLLLKGDSIFSNNEELLETVMKLRSLRVLGVTDGSPECWSELHPFKELELVYFTPKRQYRIGEFAFISYISKTVWTINTEKTIFIMDSTNTRIKFFKDLE